MGLRTGGALAATAVAGAILVGCAPSSATPPTALAAGAASPARPSIGDLPVEAWWGGPAYWGSFEKAAAAGWADPSFFPIGVFYGKPVQAAALAAIGVNTFVGAEHDGSPLSAITDEGISVVAQSEWTVAEVGDDPRVVGWHVSDECDMGYSGCTPDWSHDNGDLGRLAVQRSYAAPLRARADGRFLQADFGNGVLGTYWAVDTMPDHVALMDVTGVDAYAATSPSVRDLLASSPYWPAGADPAASGAYGWVQDRMETFSTPAAATPNWVFVEAGDPLLDEPGARAITPEEISGAVWSALIAGAAGIVYFQHSNECGSYALVDCAPARAAVAAVDDEVQRLAPVLNTPSSTWSFGSGLSTSLKLVDGEAWILAMTDGGSGERTFTLPAGLDASTIEVVGEGRTLAGQGGVFTDVFDDDTSHHVYRIAIR